MLILARLSVGAKLGATCYFPNMAGSKRRGYGEDSIYFDHASDCEDRYAIVAARGALARSISLGFGHHGKRVRRKVSGRTKTEVKDKLQLLHDELRAGVRGNLQA